MGEGAQLQRECGASQASRSRARTDGKALDGARAEWARGKMVERQRERELAAWPLGTEGDGALVCWDLVRGEGAGVYQ
jgi:hypothetical protein